MRVVLLFFLLAACARATRPGGPDEEGLASFYSASLEGRPTASGEPYRGASLTAAHRTLPFGTCVRVTAVATGRSVQVRVNDRGPFVSGRVIDVSRAAAEQLGLVQAGIARVRLSACAP